MSNPYGSGSGGKFYNSGGFRNAGSGSRSAGKKKSIYNKENDKVSILGMGCIDL